MTTAKPISLGRAWDLLDGLVPAIAAACPALDALEPAGDIRRVEALVSSVVLVARADDPAAAMAALASSRILDRVTTRTDRRIAGTSRNTPVDILLAAPEDYGSTLFRGHRLGRAHQRDDAPRAPR